MNQQDYLERIRKRELRTAYREKRLDYEQGKREWKREKKQTENGLTARFPECFGKTIKKRANRRKNPGRKLFLICIHTSP